MKTKLLVAVMLLVGCVPPPPYPSGQYDGKSTPSANDSKPANALSRDASDCERQAALSSSAGSRSEAFNNCMKARRVPN